MTRASALRRLGTTAAAVAVPAMLLLGGGTAQAASAVFVTPRPAVRGVVATVSSGQLSGWCSYTAIVQGNPIDKPAPALGVPLYLVQVSHPIGGPIFTASPWFPSYPTGSTWDVTVAYPNGVASTQTMW